MSSLTYERRPSEGNVVIDADADGVCIRIEHSGERSWGLVIGWCVLGVVAAIPMAVLLLTRRPIVTPSFVVGGIAMTMPFLLAVLAAVRMKVPPSTIVANAGGLEFRRATPTIVTDRWTRDEIVAIAAVPVSVDPKWSELVLGMKDGDEVVLGNGPAIEIESMAEALRNAMKIKPEAPA